MLESVPNIEETLSELRQLIELNEEASIDAEGLEEQQSEFESKINSVLETLKKGRKVLKSVQSDSSEQLQDVCLLDEKLERLEDEYGEVVALWEKKNETRIIDESVAGFNHDSKQVRT